MLDFKRATQLLLLACICSAGLAVESPSHLGFGMIPGSKFGTVGLDHRFSSGSFFPEQWERNWVPVDPVFRAGVVVVPRLAVGAELALIWTFPYSGAVFTSTPSFGFSPTLTWFPSVPLRLVRPYASAGAGMTYHGYQGVGWRVKAVAGVSAVSGVPAGPGLEVGWYHDRLTLQTLSGESATFTGNTFFIGIRLMGFRQ